MTTTHLSRPGLEDDNLLRGELFISGRWQPASTGRTFPVRDPATGAVIADVADGDASDARDAVEAAAAAWGEWRSLTAKQRAAALKELHAAIVDNASDLASLITAEMGKPLREAQWEVGLASDFFEWYAEEAKRAYGEVIPTHDPSMRLFVIEQPVGVAVAITPWNFPLSTIARKVAPALAAGCTVVVKPAEDTPLSALALAELADRAGLPPGVINVVTAADPVAVGGELTANPTVRKVSFTGSSEVGRLLMRQSADTLKKLSLELGGNAPFVVFADADLDAAVRGAVVSKYRNGGQTCICANRIFVHVSVMEEFSRRLAGAAAALKVGPGMDQASEIGPLINTEALNKVNRLVGEAVDQGARVVVGGKPHELGGTYYQPTVLEGATLDMAIANEEIFGPVANLYSFDTESEAIELANATPYGLSAYVYTRDSARSWRMSEALEFGMVGVNTGIFTTEVAPFGGVKQSGIGREGGRQGLKEFMVSKYVAIGGIGA
ncbi:MAG TPA: NAD-dependent succinate-semialdehyde dehydrogenase [Acidimicrobiia bacterium]|nr:NAD-dependent succinate-semialdehyde dehydrogenase [Acidimicrobiia bacterium]